MKLPGFPGLPLVYQHEINKFRSTVFEVWGPSVGPGPKTLGWAGACAAARAGHHSMKGRGAVGGAPRNPRRRPHRGGKPRLKSGYPRKDPRKNLWGRRAQPVARPGAECVPWRGAIHRGQSGGPPAEPAHRHLQIRKSVFFSRFSQSPFKRVVPWNVSNLTVGR